MHLTEMYLLYWQIDFKIKKEKRKLFFYFKRVDKKLPLLPKMYTYIVEGFSLFIKSFCMFFSLVIIMKV